MEGSIPPPGEPVAEKREKEYVLSGRDNIMTAEDLKRISDAFHGSDRDKDGYIARSDLLQCIDLIEPNLPAGRLDLIRANIACSSAADPLYEVSDLIRIIEEIRPGPVNELLTNHVACVAPRTYTKDMSISLNFGSMSEAPFDLLDSTPAILSPLSKVSSLLIRSGRKLFTEMDITGKQFSRPASPQYQDFSFHHCADGDPSTLDFEFFGEDEASMKDKECHSHEFKLMKNRRQSQQMKRMSILTNEQPRTRGKPTKRLITSDRATDRRKILQDPIIRKQLLQQKNHKVGPRS